ncbi:MAG: CRTAC1 family protein [Thermoanaerobaculia bacterium]
MTAENHQHDESLDTESADDAVIGVWFRRSLLAFGAMALIVAAVVLYQRRPVEEAPEVEIEQEAPEIVVAESIVPRLEFTDVTVEAGIDFVHVNGAEGDKLLPETMGSGAAFFDYDNDRDQDLLLVNSQHWSESGRSNAGITTRLYENDGSGRFADVSRQKAIDLTLYGTGVATGDFDGDGRTDVYIAAVGENRLLRNTRNGFVDVTAEAGVAGTAETWSSSAAFFDADNDGDLDLYVSNYVTWSREIDREVDYQLTGVGKAYGPPVNYEGTYPTLYRNEGDGTFSDVSEAAGVRIANQATGVPVGKGLGVIPIDLDLDGFLDLFVANDTVRNFLFHNLGDGTFEEVGEFWGVAYGRQGEATGAMGVDAGHFRNDSELGFGIGNFANEMTSLYLSQGDPTLFADEAIGEGIGAPSRLALSFGLLFLDVDLDGRLDILQTNGHLENRINAVDPSQTYEQASQLFWNAGPLGRTGFVLAEPALVGDLAQHIVGRGSAYADIDGDGDLDVVMTQAGRRPILLRNDQSLGHHWLRIALSFEAPNREAIGARVELTAGGLTQRRTVMPSRSYQSQSELPVTFGLGAVAEVDSLTVVWPDGTEQEVTVQGVDRTLTVERR